jgi:hypothetical protein
MPAIHRAHNLNVRIKCGKFRTRKCALDKNDADWNGLNPTIPINRIFLTKTALKHAAITRAAFDYQDLIGIEVLIDFFRDPRRYQWVELESEDRSAGYLDDVVALRADGRFEYTQVKFTVDPDRYPLSWDWLLERKAHGTSRLKKWAETAERPEVQAFPIRPACRSRFQSQSGLRTSRRSARAMDRTLERTQKRAGSTEGSRGLL